MRFPRSELKIIFILCAIQIFHIVDFVLIMPLGPIFMREFQIGPDRFSFLVSAYTWSSALFGFMGSLVIDRFDRKRALLVGYIGFTLGNILCTFAHDIHFLIFARAFTGAFSGFMISNVFAIVGDSIPESRRGSAMGMVMAAFPVASVLGVPFGTYLANQGSWNTPFGVLSIISFAVIGLIVFWLPPVRSHLNQKAEGTALSRVLHFLKNKNYWPSFVFVFLLMIGAFTVVPFVAVFLTSNVGFPEKNLYIVYLTGGVLTFFTSQWFGRLTDRYGKLFMFRLLASLSVVPILLVTHLPAVSAPLALIAFALFMSLVSGRFVPAMTLITGSVEVQRRGAFMSLSTCIQHLGGGFASLISGSLLSTASDGKLVGFGSIGWIAALFSLICVFLAGTFPNARSDSKNL